MLRLLPNLIKYRIFQGHSKHINTENTKVYTEFILDGAEATTGECKTFPLKLLVNPVITEDTDNIQLYVNSPPCTGGVINIKVMLLWFTCLFFSKVLLFEKWPILKNYLLYFAGWELLGWIDFRLISSDSWWWEMWRYHSGRKLYQLSATQEQT